MNPALLAVVTTRLGRSEPTLTRVAGGDINDAYEARWPGGDRLFIKTRKGLAGDAYRTEADGLRWLAEARALRIPKVVAQSGARRSDRVPRPRAHGAHRRRRSTTTIGSATASPRCTPRERRGSATPRTTGSDRSRSRTARTTRGPPSTPRSACCRWSAARSTAATRRRRGPRSPIDSPRRLPELAGPAEPPARLHGDLWSGNVITDSRGQPVLIDPAVYGGHREVDLAMLALFGGLSPRVVAAYEARTPLAAGWKARTRLWQIYPLLVHTVLFRGSYVDAAEAAMRAYL